MQTIHTNSLPIYYNHELIFLPVTHSGIDPGWILDLKELLQYILDQLPQDFSKTYYPISYTTTTHNTGKVTHVIVFQLMDMKTPLELTDITKEEIIELFYDPNFSWPDKPILLQTPSSIIVINQGSI